MRVEPGVLAGEMVILEPDRRASALARVLGGRRVARNGVRYFMSCAKAEQFMALHAAGYWPVNKKGMIVFMRDPLPLGLYEALAIARKPLDSALIGDKNDLPLDAGI